MIVFQWGISKRTRKERKKKTLGETKESNYHRGKIIRQGVVVSLSELLLPVQKNFYHQRQRKEPKGEEKWKKEYTATAAADGPSI